MTNKQKAIAAILSMAFINLAASATSPALATISQSFPDSSHTAIASIATLPSLTAVPFTILCGLIAGRKIRFRTLTLIGLATACIGGILPYFAHSIGQILVGRAILGIGTGLTAPMCNTLVLFLFSGEDVPKQLGRNGMSTNIGAVLFQLIGGYLCGYSWRMPFLSYLAVIPVILIVMLLLPEPESSADQSKQRLRLTEILTAHVVGWSVFYSAHMIFFYPFVTEMSGIVQRNGYGTASVSAVILSVCTGAGVLAGYAFYRIHQACGKKTFSVAFGCCALGYGILLLSKNAAGLLLCAAIFGLGYGLALPTFTYYLGLPLKPAFRAASFSVYHIFSSVASFGSAYILAFLKQAVRSSHERFSFEVGILFYIAAAVLVLIFSGKSRDGQI